MFVKENAGWAILSASIFKKQFPECLHFQSHIGFML